uniref:Heparin cofactor 2 n=1 Tax=Zeugodacus cucurbitae TaxID=28588 RepID=A0A0A1WW98_ZEUCU
MQALKKAYKLERHFPLKVLFLLVSTTLTYGQDVEFCQSVDFKVCSWYILSTTQILQNATDNIIVSPSNIQALLQRPQAIGLRFGMGEEQEGQPENKNPFVGVNAIFTESKENLNNIDYLEMFYNCSIQEKSTKNPLISTLDDITISFDGIENLKVLVLNIFSFKETLQINFKYTLNITYYTRPDSIIVPAVETTENLRYHDSQILDAKILELPYSNGFSMYILLPHTKQGVNEMINNLGYEQLKRIEWMMEERRVNVVLPTFRTSYMMNMREHIQEISEHRFDVDFSTTFNVETNKTNFYQFTALQFNGSGEAVEEDYSKTRSNKYVKFHVDRPFVFYIAVKDRIVCIGKVVNPMQ